MESCAAEVDATRAGESLARDIGIVGVERHHQRTLSAIDQRDCIGQIAVRHQRRDGAERLGVVHAVRFARRVAAQKHRRQERAFAVGLVVGMMAQKMLDENVATGAPAAKNSANSEAKPKSADR